MGKRATNRNRLVTIRSSFNQGRDFLLSNFNGLLLQPTRKQAGQDFWRCTTLYDPFMKQSRYQNRSQLSPSRWLAKASKASTAFINAPGCSLFRNLSSEETAEPIKYKSQEGECNNMEIETNDISGWLKTSPPELKVQAGKVYSSARLLEVERIARNCHGKEAGYAVFTFLVREGDAEAYLKYFAALPSEELPWQKCVKLHAVIRALDPKGETSNLQSLVGRTCHVLPGEDRGGRLVVKTLLPAIATPNTLQPSDVPTSAVTR